MVVVTRLGAREIQMAALEATKATEEARLLYHNALATEKVTVNTMIVFTDHTNLDHKLFHVLKISEELTRFTARLWAGKLHSTGQLLVKHLFQKTQVLCSK